MEICNNVAKINIRCNVATVRKLPYICVTNQKNMKTQIFITGQINGNHTLATPLMQQHRAIKQKYPDAILLFRVGDFYEAFGEDAIIASNVLGITLTKRNNGSAAYSELAGFPHHSLDSYLHKLVKAGYRVAICDQLEDPE